MKTLLQPCKTASLSSFFRFLDKRLMVSAVAGLWGNKTMISTVITFAVALGFVASPSFAASEKVLYTFCPASGCGDGYYSEAGLIIDKSGHLYGTTREGGINCGGFGCGTVFELIPNNGKWTEKVLYAFCRSSGCPDGQNPVANLVADASGNLYGTTWLGGAHGGGTVFELVRQDGMWKEKVLYSFCPTSGCPDGAMPLGGVIFDASGNLYGTTSFWGYHKNGTVFELMHSNGKWTEKTLHAFRGAPDGANPYAGLVQDPATGNLYGTTVAGGKYNCGQTNCGTVFELSPGNGKWTERVIHSFDGKSDGEYPSAAPIVDPAGNLIGSTVQGGTIFELIPNNGQWSEKILYAFASSAFPSGVILDPSGHLFGTTGSGGTAGWGSVFELMFDKNTWTEKDLYSFQNSTDGSIPAAGLIRDKAGNLYGTTIYGGDKQCTGQAPLGCGVVFEVRP